MGHDPERLIDEVIEAHGGAARWNALKSLEAELSVWGLLLTTKRRPLLNHIRVLASAHEPHVAFLDFPLLGQTGEFIGDREVRILDGCGGVLAKRERPRAAFRGLRRLLFWDDLDFLFFAGYAIWNYLTTPFLFLRNGFAFQVMAPLSDMPAAWTRLRVDFPNGLPTHCKRQEFFFDEQRLLRRLDYTAEVVSRWAHAAHLCEGYRDFGGFMVPTSRRVRPLPFGHRPLPGPTLVALEIHAIRPIRNQ